VRARATASLRGSNDVTITASVARDAAITSAVRAATSVRHHRGSPSLISTLIATRPASSASTSSRRAIGSGRA
jgi:hypothetical protein